MAFPDNPAVGIVGLGQIGGSIALDLKDKTRVSFFTRSSETQNSGVSAGLELSMTLGELAAGCDIIIVAVPVDQMETVLENLSRHLEPGQIVTDVGSTKAKIVEAARSFDWPEGVRFIGGHPMAGNEIPGFKGAQVGLFHDRTWILTTDAIDDELSSNALISLMALITEHLHAHVVVMDPEVHDNAVARVSHLEHLVSLTLVNLLRQSDNATLLSKLVAGSFLDATRVSKSKAEMVVPFLSENVFLPSVVDEFRGEIARLSNLLRDSRNLARLWEEDSAWRIQLESRGALSERVVLSRDAKLATELMKLAGDGKTIVGVRPGPDEVTLETL